MNLRKLVVFQQQNYADSAEFGRLICESYDAQWEIGGQFPFGMKCAEEVIADGAANGMTLLQYFDATLNGANDVANRTDIERAYKNYTLARLMCMNAKCSKALMEFLKQQQTLKPVGETVYPNEMAVAINFIDNQDERSRRANTTNRRNTNNNGGDADGGEDAQVKITNAVKDNEKPQTSDNSDANDSKENDGKSDTGGNATVTTAYATPAGNAWHGSEDVKEEFDWNADSTVTYTNACDNEIPKTQNYMVKGSEPQPEHMDKGSVPQPEQRRDIQPPENYMDEGSEPQPEQQRDVQPKTQPMVEPADVKIPEDIMEHSSCGKIYATPGGIFVNGRWWMSLHWLRCSIYAAAFDSVTLEGQTKTYCEDWYTCVFVKLCKSGINTHYEYIKRYEDGSINTLLRLNGYTGMNGSSLKSIYMFMLDPNTEIYSMNYQHRDDALAELTQFGHGLSERHVDYLKLRNAVYASALFTKRLRPRRWTNAVMNKLLKLSINNK